MQIPPVPASERRRLAALDEYELLDTSGEPVFNALVEAAAAICGTPISLISLVDAERQWFKANLGLPGIESTERTISFCGHAILGDDILEVPDAREDPRFAENPLVTGAPNIRFYAGMPLETREGERLGTICVIDHVPRRLTDGQRTALRALSVAAMEQFESRRVMLRQFDSTSTELYHFDIPTMRITFASAAARKNLGYSLRELHAKSIGEILPRIADRESLADLFKELRTSPLERAVVQTEARRRDGTSYPVELHAELMRVRDNETALVFAVDLSEKLRTESELHLLSTAVDVTAEALIISEPGATPHDSPRAVYANPAFLRQKRARAEDVIGKPVDQFYGPLTDRNRIFAMREQLEHGEDVRVEYTTYRLDGTHYVAEFAARAIVDSRGTLTHYVVVQRDITENAARGAALEMQNERLTALTSIARELFATLDAQKLVQALLDGADQLTGATTKLYAARPAGGFAQTHDLTLSERVRSVRDPFIEQAAMTDIVLLGEDDRRIAIRIPGNAGRTKFILDLRASRPFEAIDIFALGLLGQYFAVAARNVELYSELSARRAAVIELNQVKNDLIAMLAHDFRGPLTTIVGFADVLGEDDRFDAESRKFLAMISSSAMRLASLATDTLALSRLEQNELVLRHEQVDTVALMREVVRAFSVSREIVLDAAQDAIVISADPSRLRQVFENLIGNAIKYSPGGEPVTINLREQSGGAVIEVRDGGIGIPQADMHKLFGRFARAQNARTMGIGGSGFGLYLTKTIVDMHGGTIDVESREGSGSTFTVTLPQALAVAARPHRRVLLVDRDGDARSYVAHALRDDGYAVTVVPSGERMLAALAEAEFDIGIIDVDSAELAPSAIVAAVRDRIALVWIGEPPIERLTGRQTVMGKPFLIRDLYVAVATALGTPASSRALSLSRTS